MSRPPASNRYSATAPLTPRDSHNEDPSESSQGAGRKRGASEMEGEAEQEASFGSNEGTSDLVERREAESTSDFRLMCPARPKRGRRRKGPRGHLEERAPSLCPELSISFEVFPGREWATLKSFKNAKFQEPIEALYSVGQMIYVNQRDEIPASPPADVTEEEKLQYDKHNFWVALISDFRAKTQDKVYVLVFWLYWPEELPMGRQSYHGERELVLSNHIGMIEAQSIATHAEVSHWDENDDSNTKVLQERFWRQTLDVTKSSVNPRTGLSTLRPYCICRGFDNPGLEMLQCQMVGCGMWNHELCLCKDWEEKAWAKFLKGALGHEVPESEIPSKMAHVANIQITTDNTSQAASIDSRAGGEGQIPWQGKLEARIIKAVTSGSEVHFGVVIQHVPSAEGARVAGFEPMVWCMNTNCLKCDGPLEE